MLAEALDLEADGRRLAEEHLDEADYRALLAAEERGEIEVLRGV